jgi:hypothetical protein
MASQLCQQGLADGIEAVKFNRVASRCNGIGVVAEVLIRDGQVPKSLGCVAAKGGSRGVCLPSARPAGVWRWWTRGDSNP